MMTFPSRSKSSTHTRGPSYLIPTASGAENLISRDQDRLAPKDVKNGLSPTRSPRSSREGESISEHSEKPVDKPAHASRRSSSRHTRDRRRNGGKKKTRSWRKLLWVDQDYPDNYTDEATFLAELKWNPRFRPYEFWSLLFDSAVIIQQLCSLVIFICCFVGIFQERVSPVLIVGVGSLCTLLGWFIQDQWRSRQGDGTKEAPEGSSGQKVSDERVHEDDAVSPREAMAGLGLTNALVRSRATLPSISTTSLPYGHSSPSSSIHSAIGDDIRSPRTGDYGNLPPHPPQILENSRNQERLAIAKSAVLIFAALLGLSPILKSLTRSTSSDSIWAGSCWLFVMNLFFFDYGSVSEAR